METDREFLDRMIASNPDELLTEADEERVEELAEIFSSLYDYFFFLSDGT